MKSWHTPIALVGNIYTGLNANECPFGGNDWTIYGDHCYRLMTHEEPLSWNDAHKVCSRIVQNGNLVSIRNQADMDFVHAMFVELYVNTNITISYIGRCNISL